MHSRSNDHTVPPHRISLREELYLIPVPIRKVMSQHPTTHYADGVESTEPFDRTLSILSSVLNAATLPSRAGDRR